MVKHEIDKETLRHDAYKETMFRLTGFVLKHQKRFITGGVVVVLVLVAIFAGVAYQGYQNEKMSEAFYKVEKQLQNTVAGTKDDLDRARKELDQFVKEHPTAKQAPTAWMQIARLAWEQKDLDRSEQAFKAVLDHDEANDATKLLARIGMARLLENRGDYAGAGGYYQSVDGEENSVLKAFHLGRIALAQKNAAEARRQLEIVSKQMPPSILSQWADDLLLSLPQ